MSTLPSSQVLEHRNAEACDSDAGGLVRVYVVGRHGGEGALHGPTFTSLLLLGPGLSARGHYFTCSKQQSCKAASVNAKKVEARGD